MIFFYLSITLDNERMTTKMYAVTVNLVSTSKNIP